MGGAAAGFRPDPALLARFRADLEALTAGAPERLGVAVSGGPDSLALMLLAAAAYPGRVEAATVDHRLRPESAAEAAFVGNVCVGFAVPHRTIALDWPEPPTSNIQARARDARYAALTSWAGDRNIPFLATGHHLDDQAETFLMRAARGSGVAGLAGTRAIGKLGAPGGEPVSAVRPLLGWHRRELAALVTASGLAPLNDPSNQDDRFDRTRARELLAATPWLAPERVAATASHLADAEEALAWAGRHWFEERGEVRPGGSVIVAAADLPRELQRRLLIEALRAIGSCNPPPGPKLARLLDTLGAGRSATLAGVRIAAGPPWRLTLAPPRAPLRRPAR